MRSLFICMLLVLGIVSSAVAGEYNFISPEDMKQKIDAGSELIIVDIQVEKEYKQHRLPGSIATYAYPVKTEKERAMIDKAVEQFNTTGQDVVVVCPRGKGGAKRCYDYMKSQGVPDEKLTILEKGIAGWPFPEMLEKD
ncbi:rhodanese-like domain-containing protein [Desulfosediminicola flagellatus]|uniref:rhodanese-like domain-containing protein n=1 Tax=Desulfosediminicola flagellatus TaxID=2569541 RepID=UPI001E568B24|nr:rhodanese-like domain-containing protein [Desulfosediminicola flagellatus]